MQGLGYHEIHRWEDGIPFTKENHALAWGNFIGHHDLDLIDKDGKRTNDPKIAVKALEITNPYALLEYVIGSNRDFWCFDWAKLPNGKIVLDVIINSDSGAFITSGGYKIVPQAQALEVAMNFINSAIDWLVDNEVKHTKKDWNQDFYYFYRNLGKCLDVEPYKNFSDRMLRLGSKKYPIPGCEKGTK